MRPASSVQRPAPGAQESLGDWSDHQIVVARAHNLDIHEISRAVGRGVAFREVHRCVDIWRLSLEAATQHEFVVGRRTVDDDPELLTNAAFLPRRDQLLLQAHDPIAASRLHPCGYVVNEAEGGRTFFVRVGEDTDVIELMVGDELTQFGHVRF